VIVEDNSTAVFLQKSVKNYFSFVVQLVTSVNVMIMLMLTLLIGEVPIYNYVSDVILYYLIIHYTNELLVDGYIEMLITQCKRKLIDQEVKTIANNQQVSMLYEPQIHGEGGISIDLKDILVRLCGKKVIEIGKLHISKGDIVGMTGNGSHLLTSVLFKLLKPSRGVVFFGNQELNLISPESLQSLIAVVPYDLQIQNVPIM
jgi:ABC-type multidrug transport system fused ATPase/permease subunit